MYVIGGRGYTCVREQRLPTSNPLQSFTMEQEKSTDRVQQWIAQQHSFSGVPPPDEEQLFRSHSNVDFTANHRSSISDSTFTDCLPGYRSDEHLHPCPDGELKFSGLEMNRYYSPNMTRRRRYAPRSDPSFNGTQLINGSNSNVNGSFAQLSSRQSNGDTARRSPIPCGNPISPCSPVTRYFYRSGDGNTFPRRNKVGTRNQQRNLFMSSVMGMKRVPPIPSTDQRVSAYSSHQDIPEVVVEEKPTTSFFTDSRPFVRSSSGLTAQDVNVISDKNSSLIGSMSLDTQRLLSGNLPDVALTAAKAIHKRELSDSLPKFKNVKNSTLNHVRMSSAPETVFSKCADSEQETGNECKYRSGCEVRKVKAFSWPKRAVLPSYKDFLQSELSKHTNAPIKTEESGYNTEKSEEKNENIVSRDKFNIKSADNSLYEKSSDQSDVPPARPPLPSQTTYENVVRRRTTSASQDVSFESSTAFANHISNVANVSSDTSNITGHSLNTSELLPNIEITTEKFSETSQPIKSSRANKGYLTDCTTPMTSFSPAATELTRNVSMSLKDLIRIHEKEIARVSGVRSPRLKVTESMNEKHRKVSASETKTRKQSVWKRHTTIGLLTHFNDAETEKEIDYTGHKLTIPTDAGNDGETVDELSFLTSPLSPLSPSESSAKCIRRTNNAPLTLPKPSKSSLSSLIIPETHKNTDAITSKHQSYKSPSYASSKSPSYASAKSPSYTFAKSPSYTFAKSPSCTSVKSPSYREMNSPSVDCGTPPSCKNACVQTDYVFYDGGRSESDEIVSLVNEKRELQTKFDKEKQIIQRKLEEEKQVMHRKLEEQKKVANAYQKLEDRYRRKVYELQKALRACTCGRGKAAAKLDASFTDSSYSHHHVAISRDNHGISVQKVDGILLQLEAWLNNQTHGIPTDTSDFSSIMGSAIVGSANNEEQYSHYRLTPEQYTSPPLEIIDQIDATTV